MGRKIAREEAMKILYQMEIHNDFSNDVLNLHLENLKLDEKDINYIKDAVSVISDNIEKIDKIISKYSQGWKINRLAKVDLSLLRIAVYEIMFRDDIPTEVSINEAIEISKKYSTLESSKFINGILGSFTREWMNSNE